MKRAVEDGPFTSAKRTRPNPQVVAGAFQPEQKRKAADIIRKGADGAGFIEGKIYELCASSLEMREFLMTVELGSRVQILLGVSSPGQFDSLPIAVGAQVKIRSKGLILEELRPPRRPLVLVKRFAWRTGVSILVTNPKTGEEGFVDTWTDDTPASSTHTAQESCRVSPVDVPSTSGNSRMTPIPSVDERDTAYPIRAPSPNGDILGPPSSMPPARLEDPAVVDPQEAAIAMIPSADESVKEISKSTNPPPDPQNPQSLPSPPPEHNLDRSVVEDGENIENIDALVCIQQDSIPSDHPKGRLPSAPLTEQHAQPTPPFEPQAGHSTAGSSSNVVPPARAKTRQPKSEKKTSSNARRKAKQLKKAGKLADTPFPKAAVEEPKGLHVDDEGEEDYWNGVDIIPDEALIYDTGQQKVLSQEISEPKERVECEVMAAERPSATQESKIADPSGVQEHAAGADPLECLRQGCVSEYATYTPLAQAHTLSTLHIMGIVDSPGTGMQTKNAEFMRRLNLYDPTNYGTSGLSVTLFDKFENGLPKPEAGDVLLLRAVQNDQFKGGWIVGASFKGWQWAVFHVKTGMLSSAPTDTCAMRHFKPEASEVQFSIRLGDWWREVSSTSIAFDAPRRGRVHKSISEAMHEEYFDCTVEVLHGLQNENGVYSVFVTDYTRNSNVSPTQGEWCPPRLVPYVLRIEMWDSSARVGPTMQAGEYYSIRNLRTRISSGGYLEGKMQEGEKIAQLDEDQLENHPRLAELLKRKTQWEAEMNATGGVYEFPHQLIEEAKENCHFKCTVEVVQISPKDNFTYLYVTDYTARTDLVPVSASIAPSVLADCVVRVELRDSQVDTARNLEPGDYIAIRNLRLRPSGGGPLLSGRLGGDQRLITRLNPKPNGNADLRALLSRKEERTAAQSKPKREGKRTAARAARHAPAATVLEDEGSFSKSPSALREGKAKPKSRQLVSLKEVKDSGACPSVFRVRVRAVDFFPDDLRDCTVLRCTSCDETLPKTRRRCTKCDDAMDDETSVEALFQLWFRLADAHGTTLDVSVADERCSILQDLLPEDVHEDDDAFAMLVARVKPLLGDLLKVTGDEAQRRPVAQDEDGQDAPLLEMTIGSWLPEGELDTPDARAYVVLKHALCEDDV
ncbi:hypothetical protein C8Q78DRAFT_1021641 [Trametes maxima]|nr:hypothetical protein C8Q78DRAFT_1021641 [Trametes maxima]